VLTPYNWIPLIIPFIFNSGENFLPTILISFLVFIVVFVVADFAVFIVDDFIVDDFIDDFVDDFVISIVTPFCGVAFFFIMVVLAEIIVGSTSAASLSPSQSPSPSPLRELIAFPF